jgi:membrane protease YdiL (CAAX protease family)
MMSMSLPGRQASGGNPIWLALPLLAYLVALSALVLRGDMELVEPLFVLAVLGIALPLLGWRLTAPALESRPPRPELARGELGSVLGYLALFAVLVLGFGFTALNAAVPNHPWQNIAQTAVKLVTMAALPLWLLRRFGRDRSSWLRPQFSWRAHGPALVGVGIAMNLFQAVFGRGLKTLGELDPGAATLAWAIPACWLWMTLEAGLCEEILFRAVLQDRLAAWFKSDLPALLWGALLFGLAHAPGLYLRSAQMEGVSDPSLAWAVCYTIVIIAPVGLLFGVLWARTRNLWLLVVLHGLIDTLPNLAPFIREWGFS